MEKKTNRFTLVSDLSSYFVDEFKDFCGELATIIENVRVTCSCTLTTAIVFRVIRTSSCVQYTFTPAFASVNGGDIVRFSYRNQ